MQSHLPGPSLTSNQFITPSDSDLKSNPLKPTFIKKKSNKAIADIENMEPNQAKAISTTDQSSNSGNSANSTENKPSLTLAIPHRQETNASDLPPPTKETTIVSKPAESPFTAFCKGLYLSPGPMINNNASPLFFPKTNLFFGSSNDANSMMSPVVPFTMDHGLNSPSFSRKTDRFNMKAGKDDINIEQEDAADKEAGAPFHSSIDDEVFQTPNFNFSVNKSVYGNTRLVPTQSRKGDIYSQSPPNKLPRDELDDKEEAGSISQLQKSDKETLEAENIPDIHSIISDALRTPSPSKKLTSDGQKPEALQIQRDISFGTAGGHNAGSDYNAAQSSSRSSTNKMRIETEDDDGENDNDNDNEEAGSSTKISSTSNKKKVCCNCKKSRCLKLYCDCFARGKGCTKECNCQNCLNNESNVEERKAAMQNTLERNPIAFKPKVNQLEGAVEEQTEIKDGKARHIKGCNCKKSGCLKKYCECFQAGVKCSDVCKCENCKNMEGDPGSKKPHSHGATGHVGHESHEKSALRLHSPQSETTEHILTAKSGVRNYQALEHDREEEDESIFEENEGGEEGKKFFNPRKQLFTNLKSPVVAGPKTPMSFRLKADEVLGEHADDHDGEKHKTGAKKERRRKASTVSTAPPKTPTNMIDLKKGFDYTPSPEKQSSLSGGRAKRNIRPLTHLNPDEYEMGK